MPSSWPAQSRQVPCYFQSFNLWPHLANAPSPPIVGECSLDSPANRRDRTRQARAAAMAADTSSSSTSSGSRAARRTRPRKAGAAERAPAAGACPGAFAEFCPRGRRACRLRRCTASHLSCRRRIPDQHAQLYWDLVRRGPPSPPPRLRAGRW